MRKIPFGWLPAHWGLAGKTREIAKAEYELSGWELERRLLELNSDLFSEVEYRQKLAAINLKYGHMTRNEYDRALAETIADDRLRKLALLDIDFREGKIKELDYQKQTATINNEPWVTVINMDFSGKSAMEGSFELDWNDQFVDKLRADGYQGPTPDTVVNQWFMEVCRNVAMEEFGGTGDFAADSEANLETLKRWGSEPISPGRKGYR